MNDLRIRTAQPRDLDQIAALLADRGGPEDAVDHRLAVQDPEAGWESCAVAVDGDRVVSTATLFDETLVLNGVEIPAGQVELVATDRAYEGRGLVRALMGWAHERSAERGQLVQVMLGIPYFYRQFGYTYAIPIAPKRTVTTAPPADSHTVRQATVANIADMTRLQDLAQAGADLRMPHSAACWRWLVARDGSTCWVVERDGVAVATGRTTPPADGVQLSEVAAVDDAAANALLRHAFDLAGGEFEVSDRSVHRVPGREAECYYVRVPDAVALLEHLRPVLSARLARSEFADAEGEALVSFFRSHVRFGYRAGVVGPMVGGATMQAPSSAGGAGVAPDLVASLIFGPDGMEGLSQVHPDCYPGPHAALMRALFPPVRRDLLTFYQP